MAQGFPAAGMLPLPMELMGEIIDLSPTPRDVVPWLSVSRRIRMRAINAPAYSQDIQWPPYTSCVLMPCPSGLKCMLEGALAGRRTRLCVTFHLFAGGAYVNAVFDIVRDLGLAKLHSLSLRFYHCFRFEEEPPNLSQLLGRPAPYLTHLDVSAEGRAPVWEHLPDVEIFDGVAPRLRHVTIRGVRVPMYRIRAFDGVKRLTMGKLGAFFSLETQDVIGGSSNLDALVLRPEDDYWAVGSLDPHSVRRRVAKLRELELYLCSKPLRAVPMLHLFANTDMYSISAHGDSSHDDFPHGFLDALMRTFPHVTGAQFELEIMRLSDPCNGTRYKFTFCLTGAPKRFRAIVISASRARPKVESLSRDLAGPSGVLANLRRIRLLMTMLPTLDTLSVSQSRFPSLTEIDLMVTKDLMKANYCSRPVVAPHVTKVTFIVPASRWTKFTNAGGQLTYWELLCTWVEFSEETDVQTESSPLDF